MEKKVHPGYTEANRLAWNEAMLRHQPVYVQFVPVARDI